MKFQKFNISISYLHISERIEFDSVHVIECESNQLLKNIFTYTVYALNNAVLLIAIVVCIIYHQHTIKLNSE